MLELPRFTDLREVAKVAQKSPEHRRVGVAIEKAARAQSCFADLTEADTCCEALDDIRSSRRREGTLTRLSTEAALLRTAVILYERATAAGAKKGERGSIQISASLNPQQLRDHEALVRLRQRSLAHVYLGEAIDGEIWHHNLLFAVEVGTSWRPAVASNRVQFHTPTFERLRRQIPVAKQIIFEKFTSRLNELTEIFRNHPVSNSLFEDHLLDPLKAFGSLAAVKSVIDGQKTGRISFVG